MREPDTQHALQVIQTVLREGREILTELEAKAVLRAYRIPVVETRLAHSVDDAVQIAGELGFPVALKIQSSAITHKSDVGGVALDLQSGEAVKNAAAAMAERVGALRPDATLTGFTVQPMVRKPRAHELIAGTSIDPVFGPVILFGQGGTAVEVIGDRAVALPPLNVPLACDLVSRTRIAKLLAGYRDRPAADLDAIYAALCALSQLLIDLPQVMELDINPLLADDQGVLALDARILVREPTDTGRERLAIRPYPRELEEQVPWQGRTLVMRPIRPEDTDRHLAFLRKLTPEDMRLRFFYTRRYIPPSELARLTQIDYEREMAFVAIPADGDDAGETLGVVRAVTDPENAQAEFAIVVRSDLKGHGLGRLLFEKIIRYCRSRGTRELVGDVLRENKGMLTLARDQGFATAPSLEMGTMRVTLDLQK